MTTDPRRAALVDEPNVDVLPDGRCIPAINDEALWALVVTLHSNVPEEKRPMSWSDFSPEQVQRLRQAALAFLAALRTPAPLHSGGVLEAIANLRKQISGDTIQVAVLKRELDAFEAALRATAQTERESYKDIIDEALVVRYLGIAKGNPREELNLILSWEVAVALDPTVSEAAQALIDKAKLVL